MTPHQAAAKAGSAELPSTLSSSNHPAKRVSFALSEAGPGETSVAGEQKPAVAHVDDSGAPQEFPDVPGSESMEFMEAMMANLRRVVRSDG